MSFPIQELVITGVTGVAFFIWLFQRTLQLVNKARSQKIHSDTKYPSSKGEQTSNIEEEKQLQLYKTLYHKLQNLELYPELLPQARQLLFSLLSEVVFPNGDADQNSILALETYSPNSLEKLVLAEHKHTLDQWEDYLARKASGKESEKPLFTTRTEAKLWLKKHAPIKYVDGAWLGHIHKITTPFSQRRVTKDAWQVLSEELGDGDLSKNHVYLYQRMLKESGITLPDGDSAEFIKSSGMDDVQVWKGAVAQLLISLFPNEFLPEILGFNLHFEQITLGTLKAAHELPKFGISGYYFYVHISIDNADSGHTAMAEAIVRNYMALIRETEGEVAAQKAWRCIQAGYMLSKNDGCIRRPTGDHERQLTSTECRLIGILEKKTRASKKVHCASRVKIGGRLLDDWISKDLPGSKSQQTRLKLLEELSKAKPWVRKGESEKSLLVRELSWKGRMFGAFTNSEVEVLRKWIDSLGKEVSPADLENSYWQWTSRQLDGDAHAGFANTDIATDHPVYIASESISVPDIPIEAEAFIPYPPLKASGVRDFAIFLPLWFTHLCLLENTIITPFRTATPLAGHIVRLLRAEYGFEPETSIVAGMDAQLADHPSLVDLGLEMMHHQNLPKPTCLKDVLAMAGSDVETLNFANAMLHWAMRPVANVGLLLGLARAFTDLEMWVARADGLLSDNGQKALEGIVKRKLECLELSFEELKKGGDEAQRNGFVQGYILAHAEIKRGLQMYI